MTTHTYDPQPPEPPIVIVEAPTTTPPGKRAPDEAAAIERIKARVVAQMEAFHVAIGHAESCARVAQKRTFVVRNGERYFIADFQDLRCHHKRDIYLRRANIVYMARPAL
jgi:hypothetical protein